MVFPDDTKSYPATLTNFGSTFPGVREGKRLVVVLEKGAVEDIEGLRTAILQCAPVIEVNAGFRFDIYRDVPRSRQFVAERGAVSDHGKLTEELNKSVALIEINQGFRFELLDA